VADDAATYSAGLLLLAFGCYRFVVGRRGTPDPAMRYVCWFALSIGAALVVLAPHTMDALDRLGPVPRIGALAGAELKLCGLTSLALVARTLTGPDRRPVRRLARQAVATLVTMAVLFALARPDGRAGSGTAVAPGPGRWYLAAYDVLFMAYSVYCLALFITLLGRHARRMGPSPLRTGLRLMTASAAVGVVWTLWLCADVARVLRWGRQDTSEDRLSALLAVLVAALAVSGATATLWQRTLTAPKRMVRAFRAYRALEPLWSALCEAHPGIALAPSEASGRHAVPWPWHVEFALYRRVIEIHDGRLALRPYCPLDEPGGPGKAPGTVDPDAPDEGAGPERERADAMAEAAMLAAGLGARRAGLGRRRAHRSAAPPPLPPRAGTIEAEVAWLLRVAEAFEALTGAAGGTGGAAGGQERAPAGTGGPDRGSRGTAGGDAAPRGH